MRQLLTSLVLTALLADLVAAQAPMPEPSPAAPATASPAPEKTSPENAATPDKPAAPQPAEKPEKPEVLVQPSPELLTEFRNARRGLMQKVISRQANQQIEGLQELQGYPFPEAAKLVLGRLRDSNPEVVKAAIETLLTYRNQPEIAALLMQTFRKESVNQIDTSYLSLLTVLAASELPQVKEQLILLLDMTLGSNPRRWQKLTVSMDELVKCAGPEALNALRVLRETLPFQKDFGFRRAVVQATINLRTKESVGQLIQWMDFLDGEIRGDLMRHLSSLANHFVGPDAKDWAEWWQKAQADFEFPDVAPSAIIATVEGQTLVESDYARWGKTQFYGLPVYARKIVFVLDASSSMLQGTRMNDAKAQLINSINELDENYRFNIIVYNQTVGAWQRQMIQATESSRKHALRYIASVQPQAATATFDALEAAFSHPDLEAVYLVTDGVPTTGKVIHLEAIIKAVSEQNQARRVTLNVIGIQPEGPFEEFLKALAEKNFGTYRRVQDTVQLPPSVR